MHCEEKKSRAIAIRLQVSVAAALRAWASDERGSMAGNIIKVVIMLLVLGVAAAIFITLGDERSTSKLLASAAGSDAAAPVGVRAIPWM